MSQMSRACDEYCWVPYKHGSVGGDPNKQGGGGGGAGGGKGGGGGWVGNMDKIKINGKGLFVNEIQF